MKQRILRGSTKNSYQIRTTEVNYRVRTRDIKLQSNKIMQPQNCRPMLQITAGTCMSEDDVAVHAAKT